MTVLITVAQAVRDHWATVLIVTVLSRLLYNRYGRGLSDIPGPFLASLSDIWLLVHYWRRKGLEEHGLHKKYNSSLLRLGPRTISVSDAESVRIIYGWKPTWSKSRLYISQYVTTEDGKVLENVSSTRSEELHSNLRRPVAHAYALGTLIEYEPLVDSTSLVFLQEISERFSKTGQECPLHRWLQMYAFDVIGELTFSKRFGFLESGKDLENMMYHTGQAMDYIGIVGQIPTADEYLRIKGFGHIVRRFRRTNAVMRFTMKQIRQHMADGKHSRPDFLTRFIQAREKYPQLMTDRRLATYTNTNVGAGSDTTAIALREVVYRILTHPGCYDRFMAEIRAVLAARQEEGYEKPITWNESQKMTYFQALIKECLRIHSALGQLVPRDVPKGGVELCGKFIPEGTVVGCNAWTVHRDKNVFGEDAEEFRPERWIDEDPIRMRNMDNLNFAFGAGSRVCLGKNIAMLEISKVIPELFRRFEVTIVDPKRYTLFPGWLVLQRGLDVTVKARVVNSLRQN